MSKRLVITGGTGFIGRAVARLAIERDWDPVLLAPEIPVALPKNLDGLEVFETDVTDADDLTRLCGRVRPEGLIHLAAYGAGDAGLLNSAEWQPELAVEVNAKGFLKTLRAAAGSDCRRVAWSSSTTIYGAASRYPTEEVDESAPLWPTSVYGATKATCEFIGPQVAVSLGVEVVSLRLPLIYGPGRWYGGALQALGNFVGDVAASREAHLVASEHPIDWLHVEDAAWALLLALEGEPQHPAYNVAGHRTSVAEMGQLAANFAPGKSVIDVERRNQDQPALIDGTLAAEDLGFRPKYDALNGVRDWVTAEKEATL